MQNLIKYKLFEDRSSIQSGINNLKRKYRKMGCNIELVPRYYDSAYLTLIQVPNNLRGRGIATSFMNDLIEWADERQLVITLSPTDSMGSNVPRLEEFYKRFGFIYNRLNNKDSKYVGAMIRFPEIK